jgi:hypothetical protein
MCSASAKSLFDLMKIKLILISAMLASLNMSQAQGTFIYDQQSSDESNVIGQGGEVGINQGAMPTQSFIPTMSSIGFIRLFIRDENTQDALGGTFVVNLRSSSINGPILASTVPVTLPNATYMAQRTSFLTAR